MREPGEDAQWAEVGWICAVCGFTESKTSIRVRPKVQMGWETTEDEVDAEDVDPEWLIP